MTLETGSGLGPYEITAAIGEGGMGEAYRAKDTKLGRDVAIKVLPGAFAQDTDRVGRFRREAQILATLNHPNIAAIHGLEEASEASGQAAVVALVMELARTLRDRRRHRCGRNGRHSDRNRELRR